MRRPLAWILRAARDDAGLTAVEYAVLAGLIIGGAGIAAYSLGQGVHRSSGRISWASTAPNNGYQSHSAADGSTLVMTPVSVSSQASVLPWALLSLGISGGAIAGFIAWHYLRDTLRQNRTRRIVRRSLSGPEGQAALQRLVRKPNREPFVRRTVDTRLIGRNGPDLHNWVRSQQVSVSGELVSADGRPIVPATAAPIMAQLRSAGPIPAAPIPAAPVSG